MTRVDSDFVIYAEGACYASVCTTLPREEIPGRMPPTGLDHGWEISDDEFFADGTSPNPCQCNTDPARRHWLLVC